MDVPLLNPKRFRQIHVHPLGLKVSDGKKKKCVLCMLPEMAVEFRATNTCAVPWIQRCFGLFGFTYWLLS